MSRASLPAPLRVNVGDSSLRVEHPTHGLMQPDAKIVHRLLYWPSEFFCHGIHIYYGIVHDYRVYLTAQELAWGVNDVGATLAGKKRLAEYPAAVAELWQPMAPLGNVAPPRQRIYTSRRLLVARMQIHEIPYRLVEELSTSFAEAFDDNEEVEEYKVIDRLRSTDDGATLRRPLQRGGSLLWIRGLEVHPAFSGQLVGARLLTHAVWELTRAPDDLLYLGAFPVRSLFTWDKEPDRVSRSAIAGIARYYTRLGLYRAEPEMPLTGRVPIRFYRHVGAFGMPVDGLGMLSDRASRARVEPVDLP